MNNKLEQVEELLKECKKVIIKYTYTTALDDVECLITRVSEFEGDIIVSTDDTSIQDIEINVDEFDINNKSFSTRHIQYNFI